MEHLARLQQGLDGIHLPNPLDNTAWLAIIKTLSQEHGLLNQSIYLQITRGAYPERAHKLPANPQPNVFGFSKLLPKADPKILSSGIQAITRPDIRWEHCDLKTTNLLPNILALEEAHIEGADDAILVRDGIAREGISSNLFAIFDGVLTTPEDNPKLLPGITRNLILKLAQTAGIPCNRADIYAAELPQADEIWLSSSTREIASVTRLNGQPVGNGQPGPIWQHMHSLYQAAKLDPSLTE
jgi:D-alanine transaminase